MILFGCLLACLMLGGMLYCLPVRATLEKLWLHLFGVRVRVVKGRALPPAKQPGIPPSRYHQLPPPRVRTWVRSGALSPQAPEGAG
jgi:hypothetical protein